MAARTSSSRCSPSSPSSRWRAACSPAPARATVCYSKERCSWASWRWWRGGSHDAVAGGHPGAGPGTHGVPAGVELGAPPRARGGDWRAHARRLRGGRPPCRHARVGTRGVRPAAVGDRARRARPATGRAAHGGAAGARHAAGRRDRDRVPSSGRGGRVVAAGGDGFPAAGFQELAASPPLRRRPGAVGRRGRGDRPCAGPGRRVSGCLALGLDGVRRVVGRSRPRGGRRIQLPARRSRDRGGGPGRGAPHGRERRGRRGHAPGGELRPRVRERDLVHPVSRGAAPARPVLSLRALQLDRRRADHRLRPVARLALDGVPAVELASRWGVPQCGLFRQLGSTLDAVHDLGAQGAAAGTSVIAEEQTAGRGRDGRTWHSPAGGVWLGVLLRPARAELGVMSVRVGLAVADAVDALLGRPEARLKWPNDVLLAERKLAGILCEGRWQGEALQWLAVGGGGNGGNPVPGAVARQAVALAEWLPAVRRLDLLDRLVPALAGLTGAAGAAGPSPGEGAPVAPRDWPPGGPLPRPPAGRARGLRPDGALLVDLGAATIAVREGHVELA